ncbi:MAG: DUF4159 domain-containing protein [Candidatus Aminicenantes bacterium]|nr:DUF4159 domain-containing protein [Candidatus Aminicenantes bacterium]
MARPGRFETPADALKLGRLLADTRRLAVAGLVIALLAHAALFSYLVITRSEIREAQPPTLEFVMRTPRLTKPFELKKKRVQRKMTRRQVQTEIVPDIAISERINRPDVFGTVTTFNYAIESGATVGGQAVVPEIAAFARLASTKEPEKRLSMQEEFLDLDALDTGKYKGLVIQDPTNKQDIQGFVYLALAVGEELDPPTPRAIPQLARAVNKYTMINAKVEDRLKLDSRDLFKAPFVYITANKAFNLTAQEVRNVREYLRMGGFVFAENGVPSLEYGPAEASLRKMFKDVLKKDARFIMLSYDHPIHHSFFDFNDGPPPGGEILSATGGSKVPSPHLEGIFLEGRLVAVYSDKAYGAIWEREFSNEPQLKMGLNLVVFALTQQGSIAQQQIDFYSQK